MSALRATSSPERSSRGSGSGYPLAIAPRSAAEKRVAAAAARGGVLRYRAIVTPRRIRVGLVVVDASSPMASLNGTDNQFIFTTMRYKKNPLVITGPGAGPAVTAGGILNDVLKLAGA